MQIFRKGNTGWYNAWDKNTITSHIKPENTNYIQLKCSVMLHICIYKYVHAFYSACMKFCWISSNFKAQ